MQEINAIKAQSSATNKIMNSAGLRQSVLKYGSAMTKTMTPKKSDEEYLEQGAN